MLMERKMASGTDIDDAVLAKFAQRLAANETRIRNKSVKKLRRWMQNRSKAADGGFTETDLLKLWKGLHYCMWMADKPLVQEDLADMLSGLIHCFNNVNTALRFVTAFFQTQVREWYGIDALRLNKFMMLMRRFLRQTFVLLKLKQWQSEHVQHVASVLAATVVKPNSEDLTGSLTRHVADIFVPELIETDASDMSSDLLMSLLDPFFTFIKEEQDLSLCQAITKSLFFPLVDIPMNHMGTEESDEEDEEQPPLTIDWSKLSCRLLELGGSKTCLARNRKTIYSMVKTCDNLTKGVLPEEEKINLGDWRQDRLRIKHAANQLSRFESDILDKTGSKQSKKKRKRNDVMEEEKIEIEQEEDDEEEEDKEEEEEDNEEEEEDNEEELEEEEEEDDAPISPPVKKKKKSMDPSPEPVLPVSKKQKKNKKKQRSVAESESQDTSTTAVTTGSETLPVEEESSTKTKPTKKKANKKKRVRQRKSSLQTTNGNGCALFSDSDTDSPMEDGEVEILIPNKKYNGPQKEGFLNKVKASLASPVTPQETVKSPETQAISKLAKKKKKAGALGKNSFASFEDGVKPPAAFVKRALAKVTPQHKANGVKKRQNAETPVSTPDDKKKRVSFHLASNTAQDFNDSLTMSPAPAFNPKILPDRTILKSYEESMLIRNKTRLRAADFF